jgi:hypothetical protein
VIASTIMVEVTVRWEWIFFKLFVFGLINDAVSISDCTGDESMINEE